MVEAEALRNDCKDESTGSRQWRQKPVTLCELKNRLDRAVSEMRHAKLDKSKSDDEMEKGCGYDGEGCRRRKVSTAGRGKVELAGANRAS